MRLYHKLIITFSVVSLAVLATGAAGLFVVSKIGEEIGAVLEGKVAVADASSEITETITGSDALLHKHLMIDDPKELDRIEREMMAYHELDNMWVRAVKYGTESPEFIESRDYATWLKYGYDKKGIVIRKGSPQIISIIEDLDVNHKKLHATARSLMELHRKKIIVHKNIEELYSEEESQRQKIRGIVHAQGDSIILWDMWKVEYRGKEALFQYKDKKHMTRWISAIEGLQADVANSTLAPEIKRDMQSYSAEYLSLAKMTSKEMLTLNELDAEIEAQMGLVMGYITDIDANAADIRAISLSARADAKNEIEIYITRMYTLLAMGMVVVIALIMSVGYFANKFVSQPLIKLRDATKKTGEGDFDVRVDIKQDDEIGELGAAFNEMAVALKRRTTELAEYAERLENSNHFKDLFTDIMRHDLLNPIGVIKNIEEILEDDENIKGSHELAVIKRNVQKLEEIVRNASDYAKIESIEKVEKTELDLNKLILEVISDFEPYLEDKKMKAEFKADGEYKINASIIIESVFVNLLSNAIKYSPESTKIKIAVNDCGSNLKVSFADRGVGIADEYKESIFGRFKRRDKGGVKGTGLGLAIVKRIVELHGSKVWVEDNPGGGSIFYVKIPKSSVKSKR